MQHPPPAQPLSRPPSMVAPAPSAYSCNAFGGTVRDLELIGLLSCETNPTAKVDLPQLVIAIICEFADEPEPLVTAHDTPHTAGGPIYDSLEAALLSDRPDMVPQSVHQRLYFARQSSAKAQALAARLTWDEKIEFSYSPEWNNRDEPPVYCRVVERPGVFRLRQGEATPQSMSATQLPAEPTWPSAGAPPPPASMPIAADIVEMLNATSQRIFRRSAVDGFPLYAILSDHLTPPTAAAAAATGTAVPPPPTTGTPLSPGSTPGSPYGVGHVANPLGGAWCVYLNSMYCPSTIPWSRALMKQRGFKLVGWWVPPKWSSAEWAAKCHALAAAKAKPADEEDDYDIHEQINDPSTLDLPPVPTAPASAAANGTATNGAAATAAVTAAGTNGTGEMLFTVRDLFDVDRHLPLLENLQQLLRRYLKDAFDLEYTECSDELEVVFHYPVQPIFELLHFQLHYKQHSATYRHSTSHRLTHVIEALRARRAWRDEQALAALFASGNVSGASTLSSSSASSSSASSVLGTTRSRLSIDSKTQTPKQGGTLGSARKPTAVQKPVQSSFFIPSYDQTHATSASPFNEWTLFNSARAAIHPPNVVTAAKSVTAAGAASASSSSSAASSSSGSTAAAGATAGTSNTAASSGTSSSSSSVLPTLASLVGSAPPPMPALPSTLPASGTAPPPLPPLLPGMMPPSTPPAPSSNAPTATSGSSSGTGTGHSSTSPHSPPSTFTFPLGATAGHSNAASGGASRERERCLEYRALARHMIFHPFYGARVKKLRPFEYIVGWY